MMKRKGLSIFSWAMYDFANTIFSMNIVSLYLPLWLTVDKGMDDIFYSFAVSGSLLVAAVLSPLFGRASDISNNKKSYLISFTMLSCLFTALMGVAYSPFMVLFCFCLANVFYQLGIVFYNSFLPYLSDAKDRGRVSGIGIALGYAGTIAGLFLVRPFVVSLGKKAAFMPTAFYFLLFSIPCFLFVKDPKNAVKHPENMRTSFSELIYSWKSITEDKRLFNFFVGSFFALNAVNTVIVFMSVYVQKVIGFSDETIVPFYILATVFAFFSSYISGVIADKAGAQKTLIAVLVLWIISLGAAAVINSSVLFWGVGAMVGISLGSVWTVVRARLTEIASAGRLGEIFGFFGLVGKSSSVAGPLLWGVIIFLLRGYAVLKYRIAILTLALLIAVGIRFIMISGRLKGPDDAQATS